MKLVTFILLLWDICSGTSRIAFAAVVGLFFRRKGVSYDLNLFCAAGRILASSKVLLDFREHNDTITTYKTFVTKHNLPYQTISLPLDSHLVWFGSPRAENIVFYFHGGAYASPADAGHYLVLQWLVDEAAKENKSLAFAVLHYGLTPDTQYPIQLTQAANGLRYLLEVAKVPVKNITLMGDSAGANLVLGLVSHLMHPHPKIPPISLSSEQLSGVILISPWVTFSASAPSWTTNAYTDMLTKPIIARCQRKFLGKAFKDRYNEPLSADTTWWEKVPASTITLFYGTYEVFADDCRTVGERIKEVNPQTEVVGMENEIHCQSVIDAARNKKVGESSTRIRNALLGSIH